LTLVDDELVAIESRAQERYALAQGVPLLVAPAPGRAAIVEAFKSRSSTYYEDNYQASPNSERQLRQRLVVDLLQDSAAPGATVLEAGAGPAALGADILRLTPHYVALDVSPENILAGRARLGALDGVVGDLIALPLKSETFDVVLAVGCLEYVPEVAAAITELIRVTKPGGTIIATFANGACPSRWWEERVAYPAIAAVKRRTRAAEPAYSRWLRRRAAIEDQFATSGVEVTSVRFFGPSLAGYPLTRSRRLRGADQVLATRFERLHERRAEFLVHARRLA
jgi:SAM-dependent methyltransferase